jgi:phosphatidylglycerophosphatase A
VLIYLIPGVSEPAVLAALIAAGFIAGRWASNLVALEAGHAFSPAAAAARRMFRPAPPLHPDPSVVVVDEVVGMWASLLFLPAEPAALIVAFVTFRIFDIVKPPPCAALERAGNGWGIMLDDLAAGAYANAVTWITLGIIA